MPFCTHGTRYNIKPSAPVSNDLCLGPSYSAEDVKKVLENCKLRFRYLLTTEELMESAVREINNQKIIAWMQGRMEFGSRALGNRSILASPLNPYSTENLNVFIKHREPFRKFAASVPAEVADVYFEVGPNARYLATVGRVRPEYRKTFQSADAGRRTGPRPHRFERRQPALSPPAARRRQSPPACRCYTTPASISSAIRWSAPRAMRSAVFIPPGIDALFVGNFLLEK